MKLCRVCTYSYSSKYVNLQGGISQKVNFIKVTELLGTPPHYTESPLLFIILALKKSKYGCFQNVVFHIFACLSLFLFFLLSQFFCSWVGVLVNYLQFAITPLFKHAHTHTHTHRPHKYTLFLSVLNCR